MSLVFCSKLQKELPALEKAPFPGAFGERIHKHISQEAWNLWLEEQKKIINELKLVVFKPEAQALLREKAEAFLFGGGSSIHS